MEVPFPKFYFMFNFFIIMISGQVHRPYVFNLTPSKSKRILVQKLKTFISEISVFMSCIIHYIYINIIF